MKSLRIAALSMVAVLATTAASHAESARTLRNTPMYNGPGAEYQMIGTLRGDLGVSVSTCSNDYCKVRFRFDEGWVSQGDLSFAAEPAPQPPQPQPPQPQPQPPQPPQPQPPQPQPQPWPSPFPFPEPQPVPPPQPWPEPQPAPPPPVYDEASGACFYSERNFGGTRLCLEEGDSYQRLNRWNDRIRSVEVFGGARVDLCSDSNFYGACITLRDSASRLPQGIDRDATSIEVY